MFEDDFQKDFSEICEILLALKCIHSKERSFIKECIKQKKICMENIKSIMNSNSSEIISDDNYTISEKSTDHCVQECKEIVDEQTRNLKKIIQKKVDTEIKSYTPHLFSALHNRQCEMEYDSFIYSCNLSSKSGSKLFFSSNGKFVIKTIRRKEKNTLKHIFSKYLKYQKKYKNTFLCKYYGLYKLKGRRNIYFIVMNNFLPINTNLQIYDIKGSLFQRRSSGKHTLKDLNWIEDRKKLLIDSDYSIRKRITNDVDFLAENNNMDYSLLIGILEKDDNMTMIEKKSTDLNSFAHVNNESSEIQPKIIKFRSNSEDNESEYKKIAFPEPQESENDIVVNRSSSQKCDKENLRIEFVSVDVASKQSEKIDNLDINLEFIESSDGNFLYFFGIVDILTKWDWIKSIERFFYKMLCIKDFSSETPLFYKKRFLNMVNEKIFEVEKMNKDKY